MNYLKFIESLDEDEYFELERVVFKIQAERDGLKTHLSHFLNRNLGKMSKKLFYVVRAFATKYTFVEDINRKEMAMQTGIGEKALKELDFLIKASNIDTEFYYAKYKNRKTFYNMEGEACEFNRIKRNLENTEILD